MNPASLNCPPHHKICFNAGNKNQYGNHNQYQYNYMTGYDQNQDVYQHPNPSNKNNNYECFNFNYPPPPIQLPPPSVQLVGNVDGNMGQQWNNIPKDLNFQNDPAPNSVSVKVGPEEKEKETKKVVPIMVGNRRRGGRLLPTGIIKKSRTTTKCDKKSDPQSQYMTEVRQYKERSCEDEKKNRSLVK